MTKNSELERKMCDHMKKAYRGEETWSLIDLHRQLKTSCCNCDLEKGSCEISLTKWLCLEEECGVVVCNSDKDHIGQHFKKTNHAMMACLKINLLWCMLCNGPMANKFHFNLRLEPEYKSKPLISKDSNNTVSPEDSVPNHFTSLANLGFNSDYNNKDHQISYCLDQNTKQKQLKRLMCDHMMIVYKGDATWTLLEFHRQFKTKCGSCISSNRKEDDDLTTEWVCLEYNCGFVGCNGFTKDHIREHFNQSKHVMFGCLKTNLLWCMKCHGPMNNKYHINLRLQPNYETTIQQSIDPNNAVESVDVEINHLVNMGNDTDFNHEDHQISCYSDTNPIQKQWTKLMCEHMSSVYKGDETWTLLDFHRQFNTNCGSCISYNREEEKDVTNKWVCLEDNCVFVGCNGFMKDHIREHFEQTKHVMFGCLKTNLLWCMTCNGPMNNKYHINLRLQPENGTEVQHLDQNTEQNQLKKLICEHMRSVYKGDETWSLLDVHRQFRKKCGISLSCNIKEDEDVTTEWVCLEDNCGFVGCNGFINDHIREHFEQAKHVMFGCLKTNLLWCMTCHGPMNTDYHTNLSFQSEYETDHQQIIDLTDKQSKNKNLSISYWPGLKNLGNTCYMNAAIQALVHCKTLQDYFSTKPRCEENSLTVSFYELIQEMINSKGCKNELDPTNFMIKIRSIKREFSEEIQHDTQEFLRCLLDTMHEELKECSIALTNNEITKKFSVSCDQLSQVVSNEEHFETNVKSAISTNDLVNELEIVESKLTSTKSMDCISTIKFTIDRIDSLIDSSDTSSPNASTSFDSIHIESMLITEKCDDLIDDERQTSINPDIRIDSGLGDIDLNNSLDNLENQFKTKLTMNINIPKEYMQKLEFKSKISQIFEGSIINLIQCQLCHQISPSRENFFDLSLPIAFKLDQENSKNENIKVKIPENLNEERKNQSEELFNEILNVNINSNDSCINIQNETIEISSLDKNCKELIIKDKHGNKSSRLTEKTDLSIYDCLDSYFKNENICQNNEYSCGKCNEKTNAVKFSKLIDLPEILCIQLMRFEQTPDGINKIDTLVTYPIEGLDLSKYTHVDGQRTEKSDMLYDLISVISHVGKAESGHYLTFAKHVDSNNEIWLNLNDEDVRVAKRKRIVDKSAYVLIYKRANV